MNWKKFFLIALAVGAFAFTAVPRSEARVFVNFGVGVPLGFSYGYGYPYGYGYGYPSNYYARPRAVIYVGPRYHRHRHHRFYRNRPYYYRTSRYY